MIKTLPPTTLKLNDAGQHFQEWFGIVEGELSLDDIYTPSFWGHYKGKLSLYDLIRLRARDGSFDMSVTVMSVADNGDFLVENWPKYDGSGLSHYDAAKAAAERADQARPTIVPLDPNTGEPFVRVEYLDASGWRLRGIDKQEVSRGHPNETAALAARDKYLHYMKLELPGEDEIAAFKAEIEARNAKKAALGDDALPQGRKRKVA